jgi:hypothetical protein
MYIYIYIKYRTAAFTSRLLRNYYFRVVRTTTICTCEHREWRQNVRLSVFSKLDGKSKVRYREKVTSIAEDNPYMLKKDDSTDNVSFLPDLR